MKKSIRTKIPAVLLGVFALGGCGDILDVENPNNLVEEDARNLQAAAAVVNGAEALVYEAISSIWQPYLVASDELYWIGSRDAWLSLDQGGLDNPVNEFTDAAFPNLAQARWMADEAVSIIAGHLAEDPGSTDLLELQARANFYAGIVYMIIGEVQQDFAFSDKREGAAAVGAANMGTVFAEAVGYLDNAVSGAAGLSGDAMEDLELAALAMRARAKHSAALRAKIQPSIAADPLISDAGASADAGAFLAQVGTTADWAYKATYSSSSITNDMASWINSRKENNIDQSLVDVASNADIVGIALQDPIDNIDDPAVAARVAEFRINGENYTPLNLVTARMMHLILAEDALASSDPTGFATHMNHVRAMDDLTDYSGQIPAMDMLMHARRANLLLMGVRLSDMYRFGIQDDRWESSSAAVLNPGTLLPITCVERRANLEISAEGC